MTKRTVVALPGDGIGQVVLEGHVQTYDMLKMSGKPEVIRQGAASNHSVYSFGSRFESDIHGPQAYLVHHADFMTFLPFKERIHP